MVDAVSRRGPIQQIDFLLLHSFRLVARSAPLKDHSACNLHLPKRSRRFLVGDGMEGVFAPAGFSFWGEEGPGGKLHDKKRGRGTACQGDEPRVDSGAGGPSKKEWGQ